MKRIPLGYRRQSAESRTWMAHGNGDRRGVSPTWFLLTRRACASTFATQSPHGFFGPFNWLKIAGSNGSPGFGLSGSFASGSGGFGIAGNGTSPGLAGLAAGFTSESLANVLDRMGGPFGSSGCASAATAAGNVPGG